MADGGPECVLAVGPRPPGRHALDVLVPDNLYSVAEWADDAVELHLAFPDGIPADAGVLWGGRSDDGRGCHLRFVHPSLPEWVDGEMCPSAPCPDWSPLRGRRLVRARRCDRGPARVGQPEVPGVQPDDACTWCDGTGKAPRRGG